MPRKIFGRKREEVKDIEENSLMRSFIVFLTKFYVSDQIKGCHVGRGMQHSWGEAMGEEKQGCGVEI